MGQNCEQKWNQNKEEENGKLSHNLHFHIHIGCLYWIFSGDFACRFLLCIWLWIRKRLWNLYARFSCNNHAAIAWSVKFKFLKFKFILNASTQRGVILFACLQFTSFFLLSQRVSSVVVTVVELITQSSMRKNFPCALIKCANLWDMPSCCLFWTFQMVYDSNAYFSSQKTYLYLTIADKATGNQ